MAIRGRWLVLALPLVLAWTSTATAADERPAIERCQEFCGRVYDREGDAFEECAQACFEADGCHRDCKAKFGSDRPKVQQCLRLCMRRGDDEEIVPQQKPVKL